MTTTVKETPAFRNNNTLYWKNDKRKLPPKDAAKKLLNSVAMRWDGEVKRSEAKRLKLEQNKQTKRYKMN